MLQMTPVGKYLFKVNNKDTRIKFMQVAVASFLSSKVYHVQTIHSKKYLGE